jgi:carbon monoxide dehydrogenase subunit G
MAELTASIEVDTPAERVFDFLDDPENLVAVAPGLTAVRNVDPVHNGGKRLDFDYRMAFVTVEGELVETIHDPPERAFYEVHGGLSGTVDVTLEEDLTTTELTCRAEYTFLGKRARPIAGPVLRAFHGRRLRTALSGVRDRVEE